MRSVWGRTSVLPDSLTHRLDKAGLDGPICAEYISSLQELYKDPSERAAAIHDFLDGSASQLSPKEHAHFVQETVEWICGKLVDAPPKAVSKKTGGFKNGVKLTGAALKQVIGSGRPSYVQKYSDDEQPAKPVSSKLVKADSDNDYFTANSSMRTSPEGGARVIIPKELPGEWVKISNRRKAPAAPKLIAEPHARIAQSGEWQTQPIPIAEPLLQAKQIAQPPRIVESQAKQIALVEPLVQAKHFVQQTPIVEPQVKHTAPLQTKPIAQPTPIAEARAQSNILEKLHIQTPPPLPDRAFSVTTGAAVSIPSAETRLTSPDNISYLNSLLPADLMSIDFQFEEDEPPSEPSPLDLFRAMFATPVSPPAHPGEDMLKVLVEMRKSDATMDTVPPRELRSLQPPKKEEGFW